MSVADERDVRLGAMLELHKQGDRDYFDADVPKLQGGLSKCNERKPQQRGMSLRVGNDGGGKSDDGR
jgi:hypothetical protein